MITTNNDFVFETTYEMINNNFIIEQINKFSKIIVKHTVIVLDNAKVRLSKLFNQIKEVWAKKQLFIFYLPTYSTQLNIVKRVWKELKERWISVDDFETTYTLFYKTKLILNQIGKSLNINFKKYYPFNFE